MEDIRNLKKARVVYYSHRAQRQLPSLVGLVDDAKFPYVKAVLPSFYCFEQLFVNLLSFLEEILSKKLGAKWIAASTTPYPKRLVSAERERKWPFDAA